MTRRLSPDNTNNTVHSSCIYSFILAPFVAPTVFKKSIISCHLLVCSLKGHFSDRHFRHSIHLSHSTHVIWQSFASIKMVEMKFPKIHIGLFLHGRLSRTHVRTHKFACTEHDIVRYTSNYIQIDIFSREYIQFQLYFRPHTTIACSKAIPVDIFGKISSTELCIGNLLDASVHFRSYGGPL